MSVTPALLETGRETTLRIELPELRPGPVPSALEVSGPGVRQLESVRTGRLGVETRWRVRVEIETEPGPLSLALRARYPDGRSVTARQAVTVLPAQARSTSSRLTWAVVAAGLAVLGAFAAVVLGRRGRGRR